MSFPCLFMNFKIHSLASLPLLMWKMGMLAPTWPACWASVLKEPGQYVSSSPYPSPAFRDARSQGSVGLKRRSEAEAQAPSTRENTVSGCTEV